MGEIAPGIGNAPGWALTLGLLGRTCVLLGLISFVSSTLFSWARRQRAASITFLVGGASLFATFIVLAVLFGTNQFEYEYVFSHADALTSLQYKIAGVWSGQQGSFLLWACASAVFGLLSFRGTGAYRRWYTAAYSVFLGSLCGILAYETPFKLLDGVEQAGRVLIPPTGNGLTPSLQNYWVVIHPPTIFMGFGSLTIPFCLALSALITRNHVDWARIARPWALLSIAVLGLGICMGGFWAYETLGWGGFWAWDPVENASFVPWLLMVALAHGLIVQAARGKWFVSNLLLGGLPFIAFVYGTFLTRSGYLSAASVHSFAEMNRSALWILLAFLVLSALGFLVLWLTRAVLYYRTRASEPPVGRESFYKLGVTLTSLLALAVAIGMSVPFFMAVLNRPSKVVQEGLYHQVVVWFFVPIMLLIAVAPFIGWRSLGGGRSRQRLFEVFCTAFALTGAVAFLFSLPARGLTVGPREAIPMPFGPLLSHVPLMPWMVFLTFLSLFAVTANGWRIAELSGRASWGSFGGFTAHIGLAVLLAGLILSRGFEQKEQVITQRGVPVRALNEYTLTPGDWNGKDAADRDAKLAIEVMGPNGLKFTAFPGLYWVGDDKGEPQSMRWPFIRRSLSHDLYLALGDPVTKVWPNGLTMKPGEIQRNDFISVKYEGIERIGKPGAMGTKFVANLTVSDSRRRYRARPSIAITPQGLDKDLVSAGPNFLVALTNMNAGTDQIGLTVYFASPWYPMELFYKPLTLLVWIGAGILTVGGVMSALYRRRNYESEDASLPAS